MFYNQLSRFFLQVLSSTQIQASNNPFLNEAVEFLRKETAMPAACFAYANPP